jgi:inhibitor of cysteine peptidase
VLLVTLGLALAVQFFGQTTPVPSECTVPTTPPDSGSVMNVATGDVFAVVLDANPTTGYSWSISTQPDPSMVVSLDDLFIPPSVTLPGAPGRECFRFQAAGAGQTRIGFAYARPFEPDAAPARTAEVQVSVSAPSPSTRSVPVQIPMP